jgi:anti-sigma-K factor RskA
VDTTAYIQSGIIESYVLGLSSPEENAEIELYVEQYPEISHAITAFATSLEKEAFANAIPPPASVRQNVMHALENEFSTEDHEQQSYLKIASINSNAKNQEPVKKIFAWKMMAAASIVLLIASAALNFHYYEKYTTAAQQNESLLAERNTMQANIQVYKTSISQFESAAAMMANPDMIMVKMDGQGSNDESMATVFWDTKTKDVYLMPNKLPAASAGKQYQLWAMVEGQPVDAGLMNYNCVGVCKLKNIPHAQAFAITLEDEGGSPTPTLSQLFVLGKV